MTKQKNPRARYLQIVDIVLWTIQSLAAFLFIVSGLAKSFPYIELITAVLFPWSADLLPFTENIFGALYVIGGLGIIVPSLLRMHPLLTAAIAIANIFLMLGAIVLHVLKGETFLLAVNINAIRILALIAWGKCGQSPVQTRRPLLSYIQPGLLGDNRHTKPMHI